MKNGMDEWQENYNKTLLEPPHPDSLAAKNAEIARLLPYVDAFRREEDRADKAGREIDRLRSVIKRHFNLAAFVYLWTNRDGVTDAERIDVIKHHPLLRELMGDTIYEQEMMQEKK